MSSSTKNEKEKQSDEEKEETRRKFAYVLWKLRPHVQELRDHSNEYLKSYYKGRAHEEHNMVAAQRMAYDNILNKIKKLETEYESRKQDI